MIPPFVCFLLSVQSPQPLETANAVFVTERGEAFSVTETIIGRQGGTLSAHATIATDRVDPSTGEFSSPKLQLFWKLMGPPGIRQLGLGNTWHSSFLFDGPVLVTEFNPASGEATVLLEIPIGNHRGFPFPSFGEGESAIELVLGWSNRIGQDAYGEPTGGSWRGVVRVQVEYPEVAVLLEDSQLSPGSEGGGVLVLKDIAPTDRRFELVSTSSRILMPDSSWIIVPAGSDHVRFLLRADEENQGACRIRALEDQRDVAISASVLVTNSLGFARVGDLRVPPIVPPMKPAKWKLDRVCKPPSYLDDLPETISRCGPCVPNTPTYECPSSGVPHSAAACKRLPESACLIGDGISSVVSGKTYELVGEPQVVTCALDLIRICCIYKKSHHDGNAVVPGCL